MRALLYADPHWCAFSSIIRGRGNRFTERLENEINSLNWVEQTALQNNCDCVICLGDFFDAEFLKSEEITALSAIQWSGLSHLFLVGNHEMGRSSLEFSSMHLFSLIPRAVVIDHPQMFRSDDFELCLLPYTLESTGKRISDFFEPQISTKRIILSHNDLKGIQLGAFLSTNGFDVEDIENNCDLFINGHLHNGSSISKKIINLGNLTGQNFSEDAEKYHHQVAILDTRDCSLVYQENPYAFNFYKLDFRGKMSEAIQKFQSLRPNSVASITCYHEDVETLTEWANNYCAVHRIVVERKPVAEEHSVESAPKFDFSVDHLKQFSQFILQEVGCDEVVKEELSEVLK